MLSNNYSYIDCGHYISYHYTISKQIDNENNLIALFKYYSDILFQEINSFQILKNNQFLNTSYNI